MKLVQTMKIFRPSGENRVRIVEQAPPLAPFRLELDTGLEHVIWSMLCSADNLIEARRMEHIIVTSIGGGMYNQRKSSAAVYVGRKTH